MLGLSVGLGIGTGAVVGGGGATPVFFVTTTGVSKNANLTLSNNNLTITGGSGGTGAFWGDRLDTTKTGKRTREMTIGSIAAGLYMGRDAGAQNFNGATTTGPGEVGNGVCLKLWNAASAHTLYKDGVSVDQAGGESYQAGDVITEVADDTSGTLTVTYYKTRSGTTTQIGIPITGASNTYTNAYCGVENADFLTANNGGSAFARALDAGFSAYQA